MKSQKKLLKALNQSMDLCEQISRYPVTRNGLSLNFDRCVFLDTLSICKLSFSFVFKNSDYLGGLLRLALIGLSECKDVCINVNKLNGNRIPGLKNVIKELDKASLVIGKYSWPD